MRSFENFHLHPRRPSHDCTKILHMHIAGTRFNEIIGSPRSAKSRIIREPGQNGLQLKTLFRLARLNEVECLYNFLQLFYSEKSLLPKTLNELEDWVQNEYVFIAKDPERTKQLAGLVLLYFANSHALRAELTDIFKLSEPLQLVHFTIYNYEGNKLSREDILQSVEPKHQLDVDDIALFYCGSLAVAHSAKTKATAFQLLHFSFSQQRHVLERLYSQIQAPGVPSKVRKIGLLFGTAPYRESIRKIVVRIWLEILASIWTRPNVLCLSYEHTRPDGEPSHGNLILFDAYSHEMADATSRLNSSQDPP